MRLTAKTLAGERGGEMVFSGVDFALDAGQTLVVTGPNGSGKSTLLRVIAGLLPSAGGSVVIEGSAEHFPTVASACHYLGHQNAMKTALTLTENLAFWRDFLGGSPSGQFAKPMSRPIAEALGMVGLDGIGHLPFGYLSTGQKRRAAIARLLVCHRPIWLLDEPTAGLDRASEVRFSALMQEHCGGGGIIVAATHLPLGIEGAKTLTMGRPPSPLRGGSSGEADRGGGLEQ